MRLLELLATPCELGTTQSTACALVSWAAVTKYHNVDGLDNRNVFFVTAPSEGCAGRFVPFLWLAPGVPWLVDDILSGSSHCLSSVSVANFFLFIRVESLDCSPS